MKTITKAQWRAVKASYTRAFQDYQRAQVDYRARKIGDTEFLEARRAMEEASARLDAADAATPVRDEESTHDWAGIV